MPEFSQTSLNRLHTCHEDLQLIFKRVVQRRDCTILQGHRTQDEQNQVFADNKSKVEWPNSKHNSFPSMAVDVAPYPIDWNDRGRFYMFAGYVQAIAEEMLATGLINHSLRYGGDWDSDTDTDDQKFHDLPHFELIGG